MKTHFPNQIALIWAGLVIGGSILAAPAKFQVEELSLPIALQVGRVQFLWVTYGELVCLATIVAWMIVSCRRFGGFPKGAAVIGMAIATAIFAIQHLAMMPPLQARSEQVISGETVDSSYLHTLYIIAEVVKVMIVTASGFLPITVASGQTARRP
ncbi:MAG: hypothetical protein AAGH89_11130 [Verrucomicrobiota bacterium]